MATDEGEVHGLVADEAEEHVHLVAVLVAEEEGQFLGRFVGLGQEHCVTPAARHEPAQIAQVVVRVAGGLVLDALLLDEEGHGVDPEARQAKLQPEADDLVDLVAHHRVGDVEIGLVVIQAVHVPAVGALVVGPDGFLLAGER